jgi:hypothetical protein
MQCRTPVRADRLLSVLNMAVISNNCVRYQKSMKAEAQLCNFSKETIMRTFKKQEIRRTDRAIFFCTSIGSFFIKQVKRRESIFTMRNDWSNSLSKKSFI